MAAPFACELLAISASTGYPNCADKDSDASVQIARHLLRQLAVDDVSSLPGQTLGSRLERAVAIHLKTELPALAPHRPWAVFGTPGKTLISDFQQYQHLAKVKYLIDSDESGVLRSELGTDYLISPDVTVGLLVQSAYPFLHAAISCKWTIRSDRVQNIRHEGIILTRHRRGRQPHIVTVTAEPLPTRLAAIARGTGEVDAVYHIALKELEKAVAALDNSEQHSVLAELMDQGRLRDYDELAGTLALF